MGSVRLKLLFKVKIGKEKSTIFDGDKGENNFLKLFLSPFMIRSYALLAVRYGLFFDTIFENHTKYGVVC